MLKWSNFTPEGVPFDDYKALRKTTLYAGLPPGGLTPELEAEWVKAGTGIFRVDNNEFPHGVFDPTWRLRLVTVADKLRGYFHHAEVKASGAVGQLSRKSVVSLDKHFIGKETSPLDEDSEDLQDDEPLSTSSDVVIRSKDRNLQPVLDVGVDDILELPKAFSKLKRGVNLTFADVQEIKKYVSIKLNGEVVIQYKKMRYATRDREINDPVMEMKVRTLSKIKKFGNFAELSERMGVPRDDVDYVARLQNFDFICDETMNPRCFNFQWARAEEIIDELSGLAAWKEKNRRLKLQEAERKANYKKRKWFIRFQEAVFEFFSKSCETFVPRENTHPLNEYWTYEAWINRRREAARTRVTKHREHGKLIWEDEVSVDPKVAKGVDA